MKYCKDYAALLDPFVDGELTAGEMEQVQAHLETCPGCRAYVDDALAIRAGFPDVESTVVPEGFAVGVMERIRKETEGKEKVVKMRRRPARRWAGMAALAACCALVILVRTSGSMRSDSAMTSAADSSGNTETAVAFTAGPSMEPGVGADDAGEDAECEMAPEAPAEAVMNAEEQRLERAEARSTAGKEAYLEDGNAKSEEAGALIAGSPVETESATESAMADLAGGRTVYLSAGETGNLLDGFEPVWENAGEQCYELGAEDYQTLMEALGKQEELSKIEGDVFLIVVRE